MDLRITQPYEPKLNVFSSSYCDQFYVSLTDIRESPCNARVVMVFGVLACISADTPSAQSHNMISQESCFINAATNFGLNSDAGYSSVGIS